MLIIQYISFYMQPWWNSLKYWLVFSKDPPNGKNIDTYHKILGIHKIKGIPLVFPGSKYDKVTKNVTLNLYSRWINNCVYQNTKYVF